MSSVNFLDKLLDGAEVEWTALGNVVHMRAGQHISASNITEETSNEHPYPCFGGNGIRGFVAKNSHDGRHLLIGRQGALCGNVQRTNGKFYATEHAVVLTPSDCINIDWAFHLLTLMNLNQYASKSAQPGLAVGKIESLKIPIPCPDNPKKSLEIQAEIVRILDAFAALTAELTAELTARKKQYNHYRDQLLSFEEGEVEWKTLGDIGDVKMCKRILKNETRSEGDVPFYKIGTFGKQADAFIPKEVYESYKGRYSFPRKGDVLISASGTIGRAVIYNGDPAYFQDSNIVWLDNDESIVTNKYLWHFYKIAKWFVSEGGTIDRLYNDNIKKTKIPVPYPNYPEKSLAEQCRVVAILDKFDALTNSITEGLPREIELRQKQYEYYRSLLLSFPKSEAVEA